jgi:spore maturation protein SpmB
LRAKRDREKLNPHPGGSTNEICTFLAIKTSSVQVIPTTAIAILVAAGSTNPTAIVGTSLLATLCAATVAITTVKLLEKLPFFRVRASKNIAVAAEPAVKSQSVPTEGDLAAEQQPMRGIPHWGKFILLLVGVCFVALFVKMVFPGWLHLPVDATTASQNIFVRSVHALSILAIPLLLSFFTLYAALCGLKVYDEFVEGAKEGFGVILKIIPFLVTMLAAISMFKGAGGIDLVARALAPILGPLQFPPDLLPLALMRPLSGGASLAIFADIVHRLGPENIVSLMAATLYGSTETTFYVAAVYFGAVGIKQTRHAIPAGLLADLTGIIAAVVICRAVL